MSQEAMRAQILRLFGPPGTGKTTELARRVGVTVAGLGPESIRITSFSTTSAEEIRSRGGVGDKLPKGACATLHSHAYRACRIAAGDTAGDGEDGRLKVALDAKVVIGWNETAPPQWRLTGDSRGGRGLDSRDRAGAGMALDTGDTLLEQLDLLRAGATPSAEWPMEVRRFAKAWTGWKDDVGALDYTDMIVRAYKLARDEHVPMPGEPTVIVTDEAQDMTRIEAALTIEWGKLLPAGGHLVYALDDDQAIMEWRGGDPTVILGIDADHDEVLSQSWRVPPAVHAVAEQWIERVTNRYPKHYRPRGPVDRDPSAAHSRGWAHRVGYSLNSPALADAIERDLSDPDDPDATVMVIASCGYMLQPLLKLLRQRGIPFHNPFRPGEPAWNPLGRPENGMSTVERILRYLVLDERELGEDSRLWTGEDIRAWAELVSAKDAQFVHGAKKLIASLPNGEAPEGIVQGLFRDTSEGDLALLRATAGGEDPRDHLEWLAEVLTGTYVKRAQYPLQVARTQGTRALAQTPRLVVGTVHSTKGAQADRVYLAPDLSAAGQRQWQESVRGRDQITRLMYVGITRAFHALRLLAPAGAYTVPLPELLPPSLEVRP